jgi:uncharacterized protein (DUF983 family)
MAGACPRCGAKTLFKGLLKLADKCRACGLDFATFNVGDGGSAFGTLIVGGVVVIGAVIAQIVWAPPLLVQVAIWFPIAAVLTLWFLRVAKTRLISAEYRHAAHEGRLRK